MGRRVLYSNIMREELYYQCRARLGNFKDALKHFVITHFPASQLHVSDGTQAVPVNSVRVARRR